MKVREPFAVRATHSMRTRRGTGVVLTGALWGMAASAMEAVSLPVTDEGWLAVAAMVAWIVPGWVFVGVGFAALVERFGSRVARLPAAAIALVATALAFSAMWSLLYSLPVVERLVAGMPMSAPRALDPLGAFLYQFWVVLFYGGFYYAAWHLHRESERSRELVDRALIARLRAQARLGEVELRALRGRVEPALLRRVVEEAERRYDRDGRGTDVLLARLAAFLRRAMPAMRRGHATLAGELELFSAYDRLAADLDSRAMRWTVTSAVGGDVPFPPLLLLPVLDALAQSVPDRDRLRLDVTSERGEVAIRAFVDRVERRDWLTPELAYRLRVAMAACCGDAWSLALPAPDAEDSIAMEIRLGQPSAVGRAAAELRPVAA